MVRREPREATFVAAAPVEFDGQSVLRVRLRFESPYKQHAIGRFRLSSTSDPRVPASLVPPVASTWKVLGPFAAASGEAAYATDFGPESGAAVLASVPPNLPTAVRAAATITISVVMGISSQWIRNESAPVVASMEQEKVANDPLIGKAPGGGHPRQFSGPTCEHRRGDAASLRIFAMNKGIPVSQYRSFAAPVTPHGALDLNKRFND
jgi:hypothetical protein